MASSNCPRFARALPKLLQAKRLPGTANFLRSTPGRGPREPRCPAKSGLTPCTTHKNTNLNAVQRHTPSDEGPRTAQRRLLPRPRQYTPDLRQVGISVGHRLRPDLDNADHRHEHAQIPQPAHEQIRKTPPPFQRPRRDTHQDYQWPVFSTSANGIPDADNTLPDPRGRKTQRDKRHRRPGRWRSARGEPGGGERQGLPWAQTVIAAKNAHQC